MILDSDLLEHARCILIDVSISRELWHSYGMYVR